MNREHSALKRVGVPLMTPMMRGCGMADLMCRDCAYRAFSFLLFFCSVYIWISSAYTCIVHIHVHTGMLSHIHTCTMYMLVPIHGTIRTCTVCTCTMYAKHTTTSFPSPPSVIFHLDRCLSPSSTHEHMHE